MAEVDLDVVVASFERLGILERHYILEKPFDPLETKPRAYRTFAPRSDWVAPLDEDDHDLPLLVHTIEFTAYGVRFVTACQGPKAEAEKL